MKILMVSMSSPHFFNWTEQLRESGHEIYWLDVFDSQSEAKRLDFVNQIQGWRYKWDFPGRYFLKEKVPILTRYINSVNERKFSDQLKKCIETIRPDVVHSFVMYVAGVPSREVMVKNRNIKWIYSSWGSDMFYYSQKREYLEGMQMTLPHIDYMFSDCLRDYHIAKENGFSGKFLGVFPGRGGYHIEQFQPFVLKFNERKTIAVKGYEGLHGRCISVLKAMIGCKKELLPFKVVVYGADHEVFDFVGSSELKDWKNFSCLSKIPHIEVMKIMGSSILSIGNSSSDGMPNTLLEAIAMEAFPIQSNPGGVTAEIISDGLNGRLIYNPHNHKEIAELISKSLKDIQQLKKGVKYNTEVLKPKLEHKKVRQEVVAKYYSIERDLKVKK